MLSAGMIIGSSVFSVGYVVFPRVLCFGRISFFWVFLRSSSIRFACEHPRVVVLVLASVFLHVMISVKVVRVYLGMVTCFLEHVWCWGGGKENSMVYTVSRGIPLLLISVCTSGPL